MPCWIDSAHRTGVVLLLWYHTAHVTCSHMLPPPLHVFWLSSVMVKRYEDLRQDNDELRRALADAERRLAEQRAAAEEARLEASVANKQQEGMAARLEV